MVDLVSRKKNPLYEIMAVASGFIRQSCLSNPFEALNNVLHEDKENKLWETD